MQFMRLPQILERIPVSKGTWYRWIEQGIAPRPVRVGNIAMWRVSELENIFKGGEPDAGSN